ncbi:hypothetical protein F751_0304 [Auxenochlorella protothecoides]|uniref:Uncharacterized protein n=1 Tax=Auxenochlorella protothecoides TaxID=3075 RepID=A0A087SS59_AUXPR|nr:hypothetical protein F751_0304 [Auxenochlorella protothecoides]KFM28563.1 hypothetical protein F751_0304 [Auxenochlorella protothecoides]
METKSLPQALPAPLVWPLALDSRPSCSPMPLPPRTWRVLLTLQQEGLCTSEDPMQARHMAS